MKRVLLLLIVFSGLFTACKQSAVSAIDASKLKAAEERDYKLTEGASKIKFQKKVHDFGVINEGDIVETTFSFINSGKSELIISDADATCGCTVPQYPKQPIMPGEKGEITVKFNSSGKPNTQSKIVTLTTNTASGKETVEIKAEVTPKAQ